MTVRSAVLQHQHAAYRLFRANQLAAFHQQRANLLIIPVGRGAGGIRRFGTRWSGIPKAASGFVRKYADS